MKKYEDGQRYRIPARGEKNLEGCANGVVEFWLTDEKEEFYLADVVQPGKFRITLRSAKVVDVFLHVQEGAVCYLAQTPETPVSKPSAEDSLTQPWHRGSIDPRMAALLQAVKLQQMQLDQAISRATKLEKEQNSKKPAKTQLAPVVQDDMPSSETPETENKVSEAENGTNQ